MTVDVGCSWFGVVGFSRFAPSWAVTRMARDALASLCGRADIARSVACSLVAFTDVATRQRSCQVVDL